MSGRSILALAGLALSGLAFAGTTTLADLKDPKGSVQVSYERATARPAKFTPFVEASKTAPVRVLLVGGADPELARLGAAYAEGAGTVLGDVAAVDSRAEIEAGVYVAEVSYSIADHELNVASSAVLEIADGERCQMLASGKMKCDNEVDNVRNKGTHTRMVRGKRVQVSIKLRSPEDETLFEDAFSVAYAGQECVEPVNAAANLARAIGSQALVRRPITSEFRASLSGLGCLRR
jgi:hypothetical protein